MFRISSHLQRNSQSGILYFRLTVPQHLRHILHKREVKISLGTGQRSKALPFAQGLYCKYFLLFRSIEGGLMTNEPGAWGRISGKLDSISEELDSIDDGQDVFHKTTIKVNGKPVVIEHDDPITEAKIAAQLLGMEPAGGQQGKSKSAVDEDISLAQMAKRLTDEKRQTQGWDEKTTEENVAIFQLLKEIFKNPSVRTIGIKQAIEFKNVLLRLPSNRTKGMNAGKSIHALLAVKHEKTLSVVTINKYLRRVSALFLWGKRHGYVHENPFTGISLKEDRMPFLQRDRFEVNELHRLLAPEHHNPEKLKHSYAYWLPWLGMYTGARLEELCQLHLSDLRQEGDVWVIDINRKEEKRLKTPAAIRLVPIHSKLIELGLLEHVAKLQAQGEKRLFPELKQQRDGYGQAASKWFGRYRERLGINKQFHSLRHTFIDELRQLGADHKKIAALVGHVDESETGGRYGKPFRPDVLKPVVELLNLSC